MSNIKTNINAFVVILICILCVSGDGLAKNNQHSINNKHTINAGLIIFPPFIQQEENGNCYGFAIDDLKKIFPSDQYELNIYCASPSRIYRDFNEGVIDLTINVKTTSSLVSNVLYSKRPYRLLEIILYAREVAKPYNIASIRSFSYSGVRQKLESEGHTFVELSNTKDAIAVFLRGGTDAILSYKRPFEHYVEAGNKSRGFKQLKVSFKQELMNTTPTYFAINRRNGLAEELANKIDIYFDSLPK